MAARVPAALVAPQVSAVLLTRVVPAGPRRTSKPPVSAPGRPTFLPTGAAPSASKAAQTPPVLVSAICGVSKVAFAS